MKKLIPARIDANWPFKGIDKLYLDLTRKCPRQCIHCYNRSGPDGKNGSLSLGKWFSIISQAKDLKCNGLHFTGGEPTQSPYCKDLIEFANDVGFQSIELFSGCSTYFTDDEINFFKSKNLTIATSFYSANAKVHNSIVGRSDHKNLIDNLINLIHSGLKLKVGIVLMNENSSEYLSSVKFLKSIGIEHIFPDFVRPFGRARKMKIIPSYENICGGAHIYLTILPNGNAIACPFWPTKIGNINHHTLEEVINSEKLRRVRLEIIQDFKQGVFVTSTVTQSI